RSAALPAPMPRRKLPTRRVRVMPWVGTGGTNPRRALGMASSDSSGAEKPGRRNRPGPPTIDLKATELARERGGPEAAGGGGAPRPEPPPEAARATEAEGAPPPGQPSEAARTTEAEGVPPPEQPPETPQASEAEAEPEADSSARGLWWRAPVMAAAA